MPTKAARVVEPLTPRWTELRPHPEQLRYLNSPHRFNTLPAGRRSGKTELAKRKLVLSALQGTAFPSPHFFAAAPTRDQAKRIFWNDLKLLTPRWATDKISEGDLFIRFRFTGAEIWVVGMDVPERIEGVAWDGGVFDEYANTKERAWTAHMRPALSDRKGWCDLIGVPEGRNHYYNLHQRARADMIARGRFSTWGAFSWKSADILDSEEIDAARQDLDPLTFQQEYEADFINFQGRAYYPFTAETHAAHKLEYDPTGDLIFCFDFNVAPGVAVVAQEQELPNGLDGTAVIGQVHIPQNSNTPAVCKRLIQDWGNHQGRIFLYGDASGGSRGTAQTEGNDWDLIERDLYAHFGRDRVYMRVPRGNPSERGRINAVNTRLRNGAGEIRLMVDPTKAPNVVTDFEGVALLEGGSGEIDKKKDPKLTHMTDALGYYVVAEFPTTDRRLRTSSVVGLW
jgi:hypothetical protein